MQQEKGAEQRRNDEANRDSKERASRGREFLIGRGERHAEPDNANFLAAQADQHAHMDGVVAQIDGLLARLLHCRDQRIVHQVQQAIIVIGAIRENGADAIDSISVKHVASRLNFAKHQAKLADAQLIHVICGKFSQKAR